MELNDLEIKFKATYDAWLNGTEVEPDKELTMKDLVTTKHATRFVPKVVQTVVRDALEPSLLVVPNLFQPIRMKAGRTIEIGALGALTAGYIAEGQEYPQRDLSMDGGDMVSVSIRKAGLMVNVTDEVIEENLFDVFGLWLRLAGNALARLKEQTAIRLLNEMGIVYFDNANPGNAVRGSTTGRDVTGAFNGSMTLNDIFDMFSFMVLNGFNPDTLIMNPLAWAMFATDPDVREIVLKGATLGSRRLPNGSPSPGWGTSHGGWGLRTTATGSGTPDPVLGKVGANPWVLSTNPLAATFNVQPEYLPGPLKVLVSPWVPYNSTDETTTVILADSSRAGVIVIKNEVQTEEFDDPARDIRNLKINERYGFGLMEQGKGLVVARNIVVARNYNFENRNMVSNLPAIDQSQSRP